METVVATVVGVVLTALVGAVGWLVKTVVGNTSRTTTLEEQAATKDELHALRLAMSDNYVRRDDYVPQLTLTNSKLDAIGEMVARLDDRSTRS